MIIDVSNKNQSLEQEVLSTASKDIPTIVSSQESHIDLLTPVTLVEGDESIDPEPFFIIRASGIRYLNQILGIIDQEPGIRVKRLQDIDKFEELARHIYPVKEEEPITYLWLLLSRDIFPNSYNNAIAITLEKEAEIPYSRIKKLKLKVRETIGLNYYSYYYKGESNVIHLHHIHAPEEEDLSREYQTIIFYVRQSEEA